VHEEEGGDGHPAYTTADPSLFLAWAVVRFGELHIAVTKALLLERQSSRGGKGHGKELEEAVDKKRGGKSRGEVQKTRRVEAVPRQTAWRVTTSFFNFAAEEEELSTLLYSTHPS
jgi:hypothetical protein